MKFSRKLLKACLIAPVLSSIMFCAYAEEENTVQKKEIPKVTTLNEGDDVYVSENANVWLRTCPGTQCRIVGITHVGEKFKFIKASEDKRFILVDDGKKQLWMQTKDLQINACGKALVEIYKGKVDELQNTLDNYDSVVAKEYSIAKAKLEKLEKENALLKDTVSKQTSQIEELDNLRREYADKLETKDLDMQMRWWLQGACIAFCGAIIGIIFIYIPRPNRKRNMNRF